MTGWRLGFGVMPAWLADAVNKLTVNSNSCTASFTQRAGLAALEGQQDCVATMVAEFERRRDVIVKGLNDIPGFRCLLPAGAFYAFPNVTGTGIPSRELADFLLQEGGWLASMRLIRPQGVGISVSVMPTRCRISRSDRAHS
jgi:aspartate/methionine/tyrosine aminotransferase